MRHLAQARALRLLPAALAALLIAPLARADDPAPAAERPDIYNPKADTQDQLKAALKTASRDQTRVLVMFGGNWCGWCHKLHDLFGSDPKIATTLRNEYQLVLVDTEAPGARELLARCRAKLPEDQRDQPFGVPFLGVLDAGGEVVTAQDTGLLEEGDHHDPAKVLAFLDEFKAPPADARAVLKDALARAASDDKRVFLHFGAPWCGWCHRLDDFLARDEIASILARDYLDVKIDVDRMEHGQDVLSTYCKTPGGIPWTVILDADGQALATSDAPDGNIGYPVDPPEIQHFLAMLRQTVRHVEPAQIDEIEAALKASAEKIRHPEPAR